MIKYELDKSLETGNSVIDGEHRELFQAVNNLLEACSEGKGRAFIETTMEFLLDYVDKHFSHEEELQEQFDYPYIKEHRQFHEDYKNELKKIASSISDSGSAPSIADLGVLNMHISKLISHIKIDDKRLGEFLNKNKA